MRRVLVDPFRIDETPVTNAQFALPALIMAPLTLKSISCTSVLWLLPSGRGVSAVVGQEHLVRRLWRTRRASTWAG